MVIDLDEPRGNDRPAWMPALVGLVFVLGGIGGYARPRGWAFDPPVYRSSCAAQPWADRPGHS